MRKIELQSTDQNILNTFLEDTIGRNNEIGYFISLIESLDECNSIAINSNWGSGKTFFVKQSVMVLGACNEFYDTQFTETEENQIKDAFNKICENIGVKEINNLYLPIYYDAWKYDNDDDPVLSVVYEIISSLNNKCSFESFNIDLKGILKSFVETFNVSGLANFIESIKIDDDLKSVIKSRDLKSKIDEFLEEIPKERADKIIVFIDELDRCKPTYAVKLLERIKHYFSNDKIIFVFSTNLEELQSSVKCIYGENFNAYRYLDRFFDLKIPLPKPDIQKYISSIDFDERNYFFDNVCHMFIEKFSFQLRDISKYARYLKMTTYNSAHKNRRYSFSDELGYSFCLDCLTPIVIGLFVYDINIYNDFISGNNCSPLIDILGSGNICRYYFNKMLANDETYDEGSLVTHENKLSEIYDAIFNTNYNNGVYERTIGNISIEKGTKAYLMNIINLLSKEAQKIRVDENNTQMNQ